MSSVRYIVCDNREGVLWSWSGKTMRPIERHESKGYQSEVTARKTGQKLYYRGFIVGELVIKAIE